MTRILLSETIEKRPGMLGQQIFLERLLNTFYTENNTARVQNINTQPAPA